MRILAALLVCLLPVAAQDDSQLIQRARELDRRAERLLDQGRRAEALALLAEASDLRAQARGDAKPQQKKKDAPQARKKAKAQPAAKKGNPNREVQAALKRFDAAIEKGDMQGARQAAGRTRRLLAKWAADLNKRANLEKRIEALERDVKKARRELDAITRATKG